MQKRTKMKTSSRLLILLCLMFAGLMASTVLFAVTQDIDLLAMLTVQDVFVFILPALIAMAIFYRRPMQVMGMNRAPSWASLGVIVLFCIVSLPAMNWLVDINESMKLPAWMSGIEHMMRAMEDDAADTTRELLDIHSLGQFLSTLLVVGFMAGLSEEILFRGAKRLACAVLRFPAAHVTGRVAGLPVGVDRKSVGAHHCPHVEQQHSGNFQLSD